MCFIRDQPNIPFNSVGLYRFRFRFRIRFRCSPLRIGGSTFHLFYTHLFLYPFCIHIIEGVAFQGYHGPKQTPPLEKLSLAGRHYLCRSSWFDVQGPAFHHHTSRALGLERSTSSTLYSFFEELAREILNSARPFTWLILDPTLHPSEPSK